MIVLYQATITANRYIDTRLSFVFVTCFGYILQSGCLSTSNTFLFAGDTDRTSANAYFYEIGSGFYQLTEPFFINNITGTNHYLVTIFGFDPFQCFILPFRVTI